MKKIILVSTLLAFSLCNAAFAESSHDLEELHNWSFSADMSQITYQEPDIMTNKGRMAGLNASYTNYAPDNYLAILELRSAWGQVDYTSSNTGEINDIDDYLLEVRGLWQFKKPFYGKINLLPYFGLAYRYLSNDSSNQLSTTGHSGYLRESNYYYVPLGAEFKTGGITSLGISAMIEYDWFLKGVQKSSFSSAHPAYNDIENDQKTGHGFRYAFKIIKPVSSFSLFFKFFAGYWDIAKSDDKTVYWYGTPIGTGYEPKNKTKEYGISLGLEF